MQVVGIGQCSLDLLALVDSYPEVDTKKEVLHFEEQGGGPVATALVALSRLGIPCRFHGVVGDDEDGEKIRASLGQEGVRVDGLMPRKGASSQRAFIVVEEHTGKRTIFWRRPTGDPLTRGEIDIEFLEGASFLLLDGLMKEASLHAAAGARTLGVPVMLDAGRLREGMLDIALASDYVVGSEEFASDMGWTEKGVVMEDRIIEKIRRLGWNIVTVTLGERGSITFVDGEIIRTPAFRVETVDTTGAGDVFHAGYIYGLLKKWSMDKVLRFASAFAALKCRKIGGRAGIPSLDETLKFMNESA